MAKQRKWFLAATALIALGAFAGWRFLAIRSQAAIDVALQSQSDERATQPPLGAPSTGESAARERAAVVGDSATSAVALDAKRTAPRTVRLLITDQDLHPLSGARVECISGGTPTAVISDAQGECRLQTDRSAGVLRLDLSRVGYEHLRVDTYNQPELSLPLRRTITLSGRILDAETRAPIPSARLELNENCRNCDPHFAVAAGDGSYVLSGAPFDQAYVVISAPRYPMLCGTFRFDDHGDSAHQDFLLPRGVAVHGRVLDLESGAAISGAALRDGTTELVTDVDGAFDGAFSPDASGNLELRVACEGRCQLIARLSREEITKGSPLEFRLPDSPIVEGFARDSSGAPAVGVNVSLRSDPFAEARARAGSDAVTPSLLSGVPASWKFEDAYNCADSSDAAGAFRITGLVPFERFHTIHAGNREFGNKPAAIEPLPGPRESLHVDVVLVKDPHGEGAVVAGRLWLNGSPVAYAVDWKVGGKHGELDVNSRDEYRFENLPTGKITLHARVQGVRGPIEGDEVALELGEGQTLRSDFELNVPSGTISGQVHFKGGTPAKGASVRAQVQRKWYDDLIWVSVGREARAAADGSFSFELPAFEDAYRIHARLGAAEASRDDVRLGTSGVQIELDASGTLVFRAIDARTREPIAPKLLTWHVRSPGDERFRDLDRLPSSGDGEGWSSAQFLEGPLELLVCGRETNFQSARTELRIASGQESRAELALEPGLRAQFRLDPPPDGAWAERHRRVYVVEPENWSAIRSFNDARGSHFDPGPAFPGFTLSGRLLIFDKSGIAEVSGLAPGKYRFKVTPDDFAVDPPSIDLTADTTEPIVLRWKP